MSWCSSSIHPRRNTAAGEPRSIRLQEHASPSKCRPRGVFPSTTSSFWTMRSRTDGTTMSAIPSFQSGSLSTNQSLAGFLQWDMRKRRGVGGVACGQMPATPSFPEARVSARTSTHTLVSRVWKDFPCVAHGATIEPHNRRLGRAAAAWGPGLLGPPAAKENTWLQSTTVTLLSLCQVCGGWKDWCGL